MPGSTQLSKEPVFLSFSPLQTGTEGSNGPRPVDTSSAGSNLAAMRAMIDQFKLTEDDADSITDDPEYFDLCSKDEIMARCKELMTSRRHSKVEKLTMLCLRKHYKGRHYPTTGSIPLLSEYYQKMSQKDTYYLTEYLSLLARSKFLLGRGIDEVLLWMQELDILYRNQWYSEPLSREHEWAHSEWIFEGHGENVATRFSNLITNARIFKSLDNTAAYAYYMNLAQRRLLGMPVDIAEDACQEVGQELLALRHLRHPDPAFTPKLKPEFPELQVRGLWRKLSVKADDKMGSRHSGDSFIWQGYFYLVGGMKMGTFRSAAPDCNDIWRFNLSTDKPHSWEFVSRCPSNITGGDSFRLMIPGGSRLYKGKVYLFHGHYRIVMFDLKTKKWTASRTTYQPSAADKAAGIKEWPWRFSFCQAFCLEIIQNRLLVFGGTSYWGTSGNNLLMELNLSTLKWRRVSGHPAIQEHHDPALPGPRHYAASWVGKDQRFYLYSGMCSHDRKMTVMGPNLHAPGEPWVYDDLWSWDLESGKWRREVQRGNVPAPRSDAAYAYNEKLDQFIIFGGINCMCPFELEDAPGHFTSSCYADTFIYGPDKSTRTSSDTGPAGPQGQQSYHWRQVLTHGFPSYRQAAQLACDPTTGNIYMCGGEVAAVGAVYKSRTVEQVLKRAAGQPRLLMEQAALCGIPPDQVGEAVANPTLNRMFGDVWQLRVDVPGGGFEEVDYETEASSAPAGPWQRCFSCKKFGFFRKCGGTCGGRAFFCSTECQKKSWGEHRRLHSCSKKS